MASPPPPPPPPPPRGHTPGSSVKAKPAVPPYKLALLKRCEEEVKARRSELRQAVRARGGGGGGGSELSPPPPAGYDSPPARRPDAGTVMDVLSDLVADQDAQMRDEGASAAAAAPSTGRMRNRLFSRLPRGYGSDDLGGGGGGGGDDGDDDDREPEAGLSEEERLAFLLHLQEQLLRDDDGDSDDGGGGPPDDPPPDYYYAWLTTGAGSGGGGGGDGDTDMSAGQQRGDPSWSAPLDDGGSECDDGVLCPTCRACTLRCDRAAAAVGCRRCGLALSTAGGLTLEHLREALAAAYGDHRAQCTFEPAIRLLAHAGGGHHALVCSCPVCALSRVVVTVAAVAQ